MESGDGVRVKTAIPEECGQLTSCPYEGVILAPRSRSTHGLKHDEENENNPISCKYR